MNSVVDDMEKLLMAAGDLAETKIELVKLKAAGKVSASISHLLSIVILILCISTALMIISVGLAILIGNALNNLSYGFFIIGAVYALVGWLVYANRKKWMQVPLTNIFIDKMVN